MDQNKRNAELAKILTAYTAIKKDSIVANFLKTDYKIYSCGKDNLPKKVAETIKK